MRPQHGPPRPTRWQARSVFRRRDGFAGCPGGSGFSARSPLFPLTLLSGPPGHRQLLQAGPERGRESLFVEHVYSTFMVIALPKMMLATAISDPAARVDIPVTPARCAAEREHPAESHQQAAGEVAQPSPSAC